MGALSCMLILRGSISHVLAAEEDQIAKAEILSAIIHHLALLFEISQYTDY